MLNLFRRIFGIRQNVRFPVERRFTCRARKNIVPVASEWVEDRVSPILVALCTYPMRWFGAAATRLQSVNKTSLPRGYQLVALFLFFPCFYVSDFFFKTAYLLNHRRLMRLGRKCAALGGQNYALELDNLSLDFRDRFKLKETLCNVASNLEAGNCALDESDIHCGSLRIKN